MKNVFTTLVFISATLLSQAQKDKGVFSGNFQGSFNVFDIDTNIGVTEKTSPQYGTQKSSSEAFLFLNYTISGYSIAARFDLFNNSNLLNPSGSFSGQGLGFWQVSKDIEKLNITAGYFYEQFGSGLVFRAYEDRLIGIDYAVQGVKAKYTISDYLSIKAFTGRQKGFQENRFGVANQIIKGVNVESNTIIGNITIDGGASLVNRTLDNESMNSLVSEINSMDLDKRFYPKYNVYAYNGYFNLDVKGFTVGAEYIGKTKEASRNQLSGALENTEGKLITSAIGYSKSKMGKKKKSGIGINLQYRYIENYNMNLTPNVKPLEGLVGFVPSLTQQSTYRLLARYAAQAITTGEQGMQADFNFTINKENAIMINLADIKQLDGKQLYQEVYFEYSRKFSKTLKSKIGVQAIYYDQEIYQGKPGHAAVKTITPFAEVTYKLDKKNSFRFEGQYMSTEQDYGSFANVILEWNSSPHYSFAVSDMINVKPHRYDDNPAPDRVLHYYSIFGKYSIHTSAFTLAYIKQVEGVNCSGGVCRLEPAFSGVRFTITTNF
ncbi:MAG: DUF6029 family protein [Bacteroidia bacterium]